MRMRGVPLVGEALGLGDLARDHLVCGAVSILDRILIDVLSALRYHVRRSPRSRQPCRPSR